jgi:hypothetical protein
MPITKKSRGLAIDRSLYRECYSGYALLVLVPDFRTVLNKPVAWNRCIRTKQRLAKYS